MTRFVSSEHLTLVFCAIHVQHQLVDLLLLHNAHILDSDTTGQVQLEQLKLNWFDLLVRSTHQ